jgi:hypothetical protein
MTPAGSSAKSGQTASAQLKDVPLSLIVAKNS